MWMGAAEVVPEAECLLGDHDIRSGDFSIILRSVCGVRTGPGAAGVSGGVQLQLVLVRQQAADAHRCRGVCQVIICRR